MSDEVGELVDEETGEEQLAHDESIADLEGQLTARQILFCHEYVVDFNGAQAMTRAGYAKSGAHTTINRMLDREGVRNLINRLKKDRFIRLGVQGDQVAAQLIRLGFSDLRNIVTDIGALRRIEEIDDDTAAALESIKLSKRPSGEVDDDGRPVYEDVIEYKMASKTPALTLLAKQMGLLIEKSEQNVKHSGEVRIVEIPAKTALPDEHGNSVVS